MYRRRIHSNLGHKRGRYRVKRLVGSRNAKEMKARCQDGITNTERGIMMASGRGSMNWKILKISRRRREGWWHIAKQSRQRHEYLV